MSPADWPCLSAQGDACVLRVVVTPNAPRTLADGLYDGQLRVRLHAPPVDGKANDALLAWLAAELCMPRRSVQLLRGDSARRKVLAIAAPHEQVAVWLAGLLGPRL